MSGSINVGDVVFSRKKVTNPFIGCFKAWNWVETYLFQNINAKDLDEIWDDTALIEAYDKAVNLAYVKFTVI